MRNNIPTLREMIKCIAKDGTTMQEIERIIEYVEGLGCQDYSDGYFDGRTDTSRRDD